jgi:hypothetical protein
MLIKYNTSLFLNLQTKPKKHSKAQMKGIKKETVHDTCQKTNYSKQLKIAFDKANAICLSESTDDECLIAWDELQDLSQEYLGRSEKKKTKK